MSSTRHAGLVGTAKNADMVAAITRHLWHERNPIEFSVGIKCGGDLCAAAYFD
jgi:hypothetical protein